MSICLMSFGAVSIADNTTRQLVKMTEGIQNAGTQIHKSASRFALKVQEGELQPVYKSLSDVTAACITCHSAYRTQ